MASQNKQIKGLNPLQQFFLQTVNIKFLVNKMADDWTLTRVLW